MSREEATSAFDIMMSGEATPSQIGGFLMALRVRGESMLGVGILPDDLVVVRRQQTANNGEIVVALIGDEATVKTFK